MIGKRWSIKLVLQRNLGGVKILAVGFVLENLEFGILGNSEIKRTHSLGTRQESKCTVELNTLAVGCP